MRFSLAVFAFLVGLTPALPQSTPLMMPELVVARKNEPCYLISNVPEDQIMPLVFRDALKDPNKSKKCRYLPLSAEFGKFGRNKKDLLPFNWRRETELVVAVDAGHLTSEERDNLSRLVSEIFPGLAGSPPYPYVHIRAQASGKKEFQVYISAPNRDWLEKGIEVAWSLPESELVETAPDGKKVLKNRPLLEQVHRIWSLAVLSNCDGIAEFVAQPLGLVEGRQWKLADASAFQNANADIHAVLLNWNGEEEIKPEEIVGLIPEKLRSRCATTPSKSHPELTVWQEFCREVTWACEQDKGRFQVYIGAPTERHLKAATLEMFRGLRDGKVSQGPPEQALDLSYMQRVAVGVRLQPEDVRQYRDQIVIQKRLEDLAINRLKGCEVQSILSPQDWERLLAEVFGTGPTDPWSDSETVRRVASEVKADVLLLLTVQVATPSVRFEASAPICVNPPPPPPPKPDPDDRKYPFGPRKYPGNTRAERMASYAYQMDLRQWERDMEAWSNRRVDWEYKISQIEECEIVGFLQVLDLQNPQEALLWSKDVRVRVSGTPRLYHEVTVSVRGNSTPPPPELPPVAREWRPETIRLAASALEDALGKALEEMGQNALWQSDIKDWNRPKTTEEITSRGLEQESTQREKLGELPPSQHPYDIELSDGQRIRVYLINPVKIKTKAGTLNLPAEEITRISRGAKDAAVWMVETKDGSRYQEAVLESLSVQMPGAKDPVQLDVDKVVRVSAIEEKPTVQGEPKKDEWISYGPMPENKEVTDPLRDKLVFVNGVLMVPLRPVLQWLGLAGSLRMVKEKGRTSYEFRSANRAVWLTVGQVAIQVDGRRLHLPVPPVTRQGTLLVPPDFFWLALELPTAVNRSQGIVRILNGERLGEMRLR